MRQNMITNRWLWLTVSLGLTLLTAMAIAVVRFRRTLD